MTLILNKIPEIGETTCQTGSYFFNFFDCSLLHLEYFSILSYVIVSIVITLFIVAFSYFLASQKPENEKLSSYECGFEPYEEKDNNYILDVKFYLVAVLFIVFDIETMYLLPWSITLSQQNVLGYWAMIDFIIELGIGYIYVWFVGALDWD